MGTCASFDQHTIKQREEERKKRSKSIPYASHDDSRSWRQRQGNPGDQYTLFFSLSFFFFVCFIPFLHVISFLLFFCECVFVCMWTLLGVGGVNGISSREHPPHTHTGASTNKLCCCLWYLEIQRKKSCLFSPSTTFCLLVARRPDMQMMSLRRKERKKYL